MKKPQLDSRHSPVPYLSYVVGFVLSIFTTLLAYFFVTNQLWSNDTLVYVVLGIAIVQLVVQVVFFLHIGRGSHWRLVTLIFTVIVVAIVVVGTIWVMDNLNYNMMDMSPDEMHRYMNEHEGL